LDENGPIYYPKDEQNNFVQHGLYIEMGFPLGFVHQKQERCISKLKRKKHKYTSDWS
jgi:hypothetical protein